MTKQSLSFDINNLNWGNKNMFPEVIYVDTCSILDMTLLRTNGQVTEDYLKELNNHSGIITWSQHTIDEMIQVFHVNEYFNLANSKNIRTKKAWKIAEDTASNQESSLIAQRVLSTVNNVVETLEQFGVQSDVEALKVNELTMKIYSSYGGNLADSKHVAIANLSGTNNILTADKGYLRYPSLNIFGASSGITSGHNNNQLPNDFVDLSYYLSKEVNEDVG